MSPGAVEEAGQTARSIITALASQPMSLAMILSNIALLAFVWYSDIENNKAWRAENEQRSANAVQFVQFAKDTNALLAKCVVPDGR